MRTWNRLVYPKKKEDKTQNMLMFLKNQCYCTYCEPLAFQEVRSNELIERKAVPEILMKEFSSATL